VPASLRSAGGLGRRGGERGGSLVGRLGENQIIDSSG
jgi:hypothetical protein